MRPFKNWKIWTIAGSAMLGWVYVVLGTLIHNIHSIAETSPEEITISMVCATVLFASAGSALCRAIDVWQFVRETNSQPSDSTLCYRGVQTLPPVSSPTSHCKGPYDSVDNVLCDQRGVACSPDSNLESDHESQKHPINDGLCYRGVRH